MNNVEVDVNFKSIAQVILDPRIRHTPNKLGARPLIDYVSDKPLDDKMCTLLKKGKIQGYKEISGREKNCCWIPVYHITEDFL